jgi:hypothetical protein
MRRGDGLPFLKQLELLQISVYNMVVGAVLIDWNVSGNMMINY